MTKVEFEQFTALPLRRKTAQAFSLRARSVLACAQDIDNKGCDVEVVAAVGRVRELAPSGCAQPARAHQRSARWPPRCAPASITGPAGMECRITRKLSGLNGALLVACGQCTALHFHTQYIATLAHHGILHPCL